MKIIDCEQGSDEWKAARLGIPTASSFDKILSPGGKPSTQAEPYMLQLLAEIITGAPTETFKNGAMDRGTELEPEAVQFYELRNEAEAIKIGFCTDDAGTFGASPDRLIGEDGGLEIKCPLAHTHVKYLLDGKMDIGYYPQVQGNMLVTGRKWWDWMSYHPKMPALILRVPRNDKYIFSMQAELIKFDKTLKSHRQTLIDKGYLK